MTDSFSLFNIENSLCTSSCRSEPKEYDNSGLAPSHNHMERLALERIGAPVAVSGQVKVRNLSDEPPYAGRHDLLWVLYGSTTTSEHFTLRALFLVLET